MAKVITITLRKGGSGKTTTTVNLASSLAKHGKKVLLIDLDPQANATASLGMNDAELANIAEVLTGSKNIGQVISKGPAFDIIASNSVLSQIEASMASDPATYGQLVKSHIEPIKPKYDYILIDTPPSESMLTISALVASDYVLIPTQAHYLAMKGLQQALELITRVKDTHGASVEVLGIVPTMVQSNTNMADLFLAQVEADYGKLLLPYPVPHTIKITESQLAGEPITDYEPQHPASLAYLQLANYINEVTK
jgi:chromosome partitioning protein